jgi:predicted DsbA family dithiol-disulfide isomerase
VAAHWEKAQAAEDSITLTPWSGAVYPATTQAAHIAGKAAARQGLFDAFHLEAMRAFFSLSQNIEDPAVLRQVAEAVGCRMADFEADSADPSLKELVWREFMTGVERERVSAIPTMFVGKRVIEGALTLDRYRQVFDTALKDNERTT